MSSRIFSIFRELDYQLMLAITRIDERRHLCCDTCIPEFMTVRILRR
ncbi:MAG: hypothetical protein QXO46_07680 [Nitrososphaerota archaeon]